MQYVDNIIFGNFYYIEKDGKFYELQDKIEYDGGYYTVKDEENYNGGYYEFTVKLTDSRHGARSAKVDKNPQKNVSWEPSIPVTYDSEEVNPTKRQTMGEDGDMEEFEMKLNGCVAVRYYQILSDTDDVGQTIYDRRTENFGMIDGFAYWNQSDLFKSEHSWDIVKEFPSFETCYLTSDDPREWIDHSDDFNEKHDIRYLFMLSNTETSTYTDKDGNTYEYPKILASMSWDANKYDYYCGLLITTSPAYDYDQDRWTVKCSLRLQRSEWVDSIDPATGNEVKTIKLTYSTFCSGLTLSCMAYNSPAAETPNLPQRNESPQPIYEETKTSTCQSWQASAEYLDDKREVSTKVVINFPETPAKLYMKINGNETVCDSVGGIVSLNENTFYTANVDGTERKIKWQWGENYTISDDEILHFLQENEFYVYTLKYDSGDDIPSVKPYDTILPDYDEMHDNGSADEHFIKPKDGSEPIEGQLYMLYPVQVWEGYTIYCDWRTNQRDYSENYEKIYVCNVFFEVEDLKGTENPKALGYYEFKNNDYVLTEDTVVDSTKKYYEYSANEYSYTSAPVLYENGRYYLIKNFSILDYYGYLFMNFAAIESHLITWQDYEKYKNTELLHVSETADVRDLEIYADNGELLERIPTVEGFSVADFYDITTPNMREWAKKFGIEWKWQYEGATTKFYFFRDAYDDPMIANAPFLAEAYGHPTTIEDSHSQIIDVYESKLENNYYKPYNFTDESTYFQGNFIKSDLTTTDSIATITVDYPLNILDHTTICPRAYKVDFPIPINSPNPKIKNYTEISPLFRLEPSETIEKTCVGYTI